MNDLQEAAQDKLPESDGRRVRLTSLSSCAG
jgi:hypothetical protein